MTTENTSTEVVAVEPTLASVRAEREAAAAKAKEERRVREKTYALQNLDSFVTMVASDIEQLDVQVKALAERRKRYEEAVSVAKSIETNADVTVEEIREVAKKASDAYYGRKDDDKNSVARAVREEMIRFIEPRGFHDGGIIGRFPDLIVSDRGLVVNCKSRRGI